MADSILLTHSDLETIVRSAIAKRTTVELLDPKQAYFQLKSAYDYIQSEQKDEESFAACPVVIRGQVNCYSTIGQVHVPATLIVDVVMHLGLIDEGLFALTLQENEDEPTVNVNVVDVVFDAPEGFDYVTDPFDLAIANTVVHGQCDLPTDYILFNLKDLTSQLSNYLDFSTIHTAIENMSVAIANSK
ncbi:hypothetical protein V3N00_18215 [Acinetobacter baumannii]|uniref:hypothetical protein n=1 Tax=Acinetobacter baumannii TaxID=470 RepID=UPI000DE640B2|nr:hypothetical protein [Acinetobacter baumannii]SSQ10005.1 Uncharacterised protein [Acinetobacter baumannii]HCT3680643.1 hypothetical protein [Acinetobacter baumannii]